MPTLAPSVVIVLPSASRSTDNVWRVGSTEMPWHTSVMRLAGCDVPQLVVPGYGEATCWAAQGMLDTEWLSTYTQ